MNNLQHIFNEATINGKLTGLANILLEQCTVDQACPCYLLKSLAEKKTKEGNREYYKDKDTEELQEVDEDWGYLWTGVLDSQVGSTSEYAKYILDDIKFKHQPPNNTQGWAHRSSFKTAVEEALAKTDWKISEVWEICSLQNVISKSPGGLNVDRNKISKCDGCAEIIQKWSDDLCNLACDVFYRGYTDAEVESNLKSPEGNYLFIDFDNRYTETVPLQFKDAVLSKMGLAHSGAKVNDCIEIVTVSFESAKEYDVTGRSKAEGVDIEKRFKLKFLPDCILMSSGYREKNLRLDELDHPAVERYNKNNPNKTKTITTTNETWTCGGEGQCYDPQNGQGTYTSLAACQTNCTTSSKTNIDVEYTVPDSIPDSGEWW